MLLPLIKTAADLPALMPRWKATLDPVLSGPLAGAILIPNVVLAIGRNSVNHRLGGKLQGYAVVLNSAAATFYDSQSTNPTPELTLILNSSAATTVTLLVF